MSAESGHSLGRRGEGERLGHPQGEALAGETDKHLPETGPPGRQAAYAHGATNNTCRAPRADTGHNKEVFF